AVDRLAEQFRRDRLIAATADLVEASLDRPVTVLAEDVHLFDTGSLDLLRALAARAQERPWYIVTTHRGRPHLVSPEATVIQLVALAPAELNDLAVAAGEMSGLDPRRSTDLEQLTDRAGGNPFFLLELVGAAATAGADHLPDNVESLVTTRIDLLPPLRRTLLREAAVAGNIVHTDVLADAFERPELREPGQWTTLDPFLIADEPGTYRFRHSLYRDVAYAGLSYRRRREAHAAIGTTLEHRHRDDVASVASLLSDHFERSRERSRAWRYAVIGGDGARDAYANIEAANLYERALRNGDEVAALPRARVAEALGDVRDLNGEYASAIAAYQLGRSLTTQVEDEVRLLRKVGAVRVREGHLSQSLRWFTRARHASEQIVDPVVREREFAEIALGRAGARHRQGRHRDSLVTARTAARAADAGGDQLIRARAYNLLEVAARTLGLPEASHYSDLALAMYSGTGDLVGEANVLNNRGVRLHFAGEWEKAIDEYRRSRSLRQQAGDVVGEAMAANNVGEIRCLQGRFDEARSMFDFAMSAWEAAHYQIGIAYVTANLAMVEARSGDPTLGLRLLAEAAAPLERLGASALRVEIDLRRVECHLLAGDPGTALAVAHAVQKQLAAEHDTDEQVAAQLRPLLALAQLRTGQPDAAAATLAVAAPDGLSDRYSAAMELLAAAELTRVGGGDPHDEIARSEVLL
ncbi:MAG TPA: tetratricopeptide repeat protein, partial [Acidimicrobiia bacterium]|nr:tetratricopeptide repeat protein [Acidimicrobiia bacterium]